MISTYNDSLYHIRVLLGRRIILSILTVVFTKHNVTQLDGYKQQQWYEAFHILLCEYGLANGKTNACDEVVTPAVIKSRCCCIYGKICSKNS